MLAHRGLAADFCAMMMAPPGINETALWQEVEFGAYGADLPIWTELADETGGPVLELGAGAGRTALHLAGHGHEVIALERDPDLVAALERSTERDGTSIHVLEVDLSSPSEIDAPVRPALAIGPLHVIQLIDPSARGALLARLSELIGPGGRLALTVVDEESMMSAHPSSTRILPDMRELDGWVYSSEPLDPGRIRRAHRAADSGALLTRARSIASVHDETLQRLTPEALEREGERAGFKPAPRRRISYGPGEADSLLVVLEVPE